MLCSQRFSACWAPACASNSVRCDTRLHLASARASKEPSNEFQGFGGDKDVQEALLQQLRVQVDTQTLKDEIREDLKGKVANMKQIGEEVSHVQLPALLTGCLRQRLSHLAKDSVCQLCS